MHEDESRIDSRIKASGNRQSLTPVSGQDSSGVFTVNLDECGVPTSINVEMQWRARLPAQSLGAACTEALLEALDQRVALLESCMADKPGDREFVPSATPRPLSELADAVSVDFDALQAKINAAFQVSDSSSEEDNEFIQIILTGGAWQAVIDPEWAKSQGSQQLERQLGLALKNALNREEPQGWAVVRSLMEEQDRYFAEALGHLQLLMNTTDNAQ